MNLRITIEDQTNAESFLVKYRYSGEELWFESLARSFPYIIPNILPNKPIEVKVKKNCLKKPCSSVGRISYDFI